MNVFCFVLHTGIWKVIQNPNTHLTPACAMQGPTGSQEAEGARRNHREHLLWLNQDEQGSDGLSGIALRLLGVGPTLTDFLPTEDCRKEMPE